MGPPKQAAGEIEERLLGLILQANRARIYDQLLSGANVDIDKAHYPVLSATAALGPARVSRIAEALSLNPTTTSRHLQALERKRLIVRTADIADGRAAIVALTPTGRQAVARLRATRKRLFARLLAGFDDRELAHFGRYLERLIDAFQDH